VSTPELSASLSTVLIALMRGVTYRDADESVWHSLGQLSTRVREYVTVLGLELVLDESEGYAYLRQRLAGEGEPEIPRLVARRQLGYQVSLLVALLRKKLAEFDAKSSEARLVLARDEIVELVRVFLPESANEARSFDKVDAHINKLIELGFLRRLRGREDQFEIQRIIKAFIDAQWLSGLEEGLLTYLQHAGSGESRHSEEST